MFRTTIVCVLILCSTKAIVAGPIVVQIDTFQNGTTQGWTNGIPAADPLNIPNGGPLGAGDSYLQIRGDGSGVAGRIISFNRDGRWTGDFFTPGVNAIGVDLLNPNAVPLSVRLGLKLNTGAGSPGYSTDAFLLPADGLWHHAIFLLDSGHLTPIGAAPPLNSFLTNVAELRILHGVNPTLTGTPLNGRLGVDNVQALSVPEPTSLAVLVGLVGLVGAAARRRA